MGLVRGAVMLVVLAVLAAAVVTGATAAGNADLTVSIAGPTTGGVGDDLTYTVTLANVGSEATTAGTVSVGINRNVFDVVTASGNCFASGTSDKPTVVCPFGDLAAGATITETIGFHVQAVGRDVLIQASGDAGNETNKTNDTAAITLWPSTLPPPPTFPARPVVNTSALPPARVGDTYEAQIGITSGTPPYDVKPNGGVIPPGLTLSPSGVVSGVPTTAGDFQFWIRVSDAYYTYPAHGPVVAMLSMSVAPAPKLELVESIPVTKIGAPVDTPLLVDGSHPPYTLVVDDGSLPVGVEFRSSDAHLVGVPREAGLFIITVTVTNTSGGTVSGTRVWRVVAAPIPPAFRSCKKLHATYPHGVGKVGARDRTRGKPVRTFTRSNRIYALAVHYNRGLDGDQDGIACEAFR
jgi:hypothetical protein